MATVVTPRPRGSGDIVYSVFLGVWIVVSTVIIQLVTWAIEQFALIEGLTMPAWGWPIAVWLNALVAGVPALLLAARARRPELRATGLTWSYAVLTLGVIGSLRAIPVQQSEIYLASLAIATGLGAILMRRQRPSGGFLLGLAAGIAVLLPWLWVGALGGPVESGLAVLAAAGCGALAAQVLATLWDGFGVRSSLRPGVRSKLLAGLVAGVALVPLGAAYAGSGPNLALILILPPLGLVAAAFGGRFGAVAAMIGAATVGPLAFVEPAETTILLGLHDIPFWTAIGGLCSWGIAVLLGVVGMAWTRKVRFAAPVAVLTAIAAGAVIYPLAGQPGFFGESLFVVMKQQADLSGLASIPDRDQRLTETYQRLVSTADRTQAPLRAELRRDGISFTPYYLVNGILVNDGVQARIWLSRRSDVDRVLLNPKLRPIPSGDAPMRGNDPTPTGPLWNISLLNAPQVWATGDTGAGIVIGGSDTGVDLQHPALTAGYRGGDDSWYDPWNHTISPVDHNGHGTHTMGSALGRDGIGVAPGAAWMACVNLDRNMGSPGYYLDCLQFMLAPFPPGGDAFHGDPARAADVLTNSWGCPTLEGCDPDALEPAVNALTAAGIFFVAAAGNEGPRCGSIDDAPAPYPSTFTVGAVNQHRRVADFSSRGPVAGSGSAAKPDLVAPGVHIESALPGGGYGTLDGTSMATPQVAGVVALMWAASPALRGNVPLTAKILRDTAGPATPSSAAGACGGVSQTGAGLVDAQAAVTAAKSITR